MYTNQPTIDRLLETFLRDGVSRTELSGISSATHQALVTEQHHGLRLPVLELTGASPCSGKKQLLYYVISQSLLPVSIGDVALGGRESAIILFDLGGSISFTRLKKVMIKIITSAVGETSMPRHVEEMQDVVHTSFENLHVIRPYSSRSLIDSLKSLQSYIFDTTSHVSANRPIGAIILNDIDAFLWQDRLEDAEHQAEESNMPQASRYLSSIFHDLINELRRLQRDFSCQVIATSSALNTLTYTRVDSLSVPILQSHLPSVWNSFVTTRLIVQRDTVRKFHYGISAEEAAREAAQRQEVVERSTFSAQLDWSKSDAWREATRAAIKAMAGAADIQFKVTADGFVFIVDD